MTINNFDGLCGLIAPFASSDLQLRCHYELGHHGDCSWKKYKEQFVIRGICNGNLSFEAEREFINSVVYHKK